MPKAKVVAKSGGIGDIAAALRKRRDTLGLSTGAKIVIPVGGSDPTTNGLDWVIWQEFGTATQRVADPEFHVPGPTSQEYTIGGVPGKSMEFPDIGTFGDGGAVDPFGAGEVGFAGEGDGGYRLPKSPFKDGYVLTRKGKAITHPGVPPKFFIRSVLRKAKELLRIGISNAVAKGFADDPDFVSLEGATIQEMEKVKLLIVESMNAKFGPNERPDGRLGGRHPADIFAAAAQVVGLGKSNQADEVTGVIRGPRARKPGKVVAARRSKFVAKSAAKKIGSPKVKTRITPAPVKSKRLSKIQANFRNKS